MALYGAEAEAARKAEKAKQDAARDARAEVRAQAGEKAVTKPGEASRETSGFSEWQRGDGATNAEQIGNKWMSGSRF